MKTEDRANPRKPAGGYGAYALGVLMVAYVLAFLDRQILNLLVEPIKRDLHLSDVEVSLLQGLAFALFLSVGGLPVGRLIDTRRRITVLAAGITVWSLLTGACGLARSFVQLLLCRIGVGIGEAAMTPSAYSLLGDYFQARRLGLAMGIFSMGSYLGSGLALVLGGLVIGLVPRGDLVLPVIGVLHGWQAPFLVIGPAGLLVALWLATLREPQRTGPLGAARPDWADVGGYFRRNRRSLVCVNLAVGFANMTLYGFTAWSPSLLIRTFHAAPSQVGVWLGLPLMVFGAAGTLCAGLIGDVLRARRLENGRVWVMAAAAAAAAPLALAEPLMPTLAAAGALTGPLIFLTALSIGSGPATLQEITPNRMRGIQHALAVLAANLLGLGFGPTVIALVTDYGLHDERWIGLALAIALPAMLAVSAACAAAALEPYRASLARMAEPGFLT